MHSRSFAWAAVFVAALAGGAAAQSAPSAQSPPGSGSAAVDVDRLPIDPDRISRQLRKSSIREERDGINLRYFIEVYAQAPRIQLFTREDNLLTGPVPYGAPTHQQILDVITPHEHRSPAMDFNSLFYWLANKGKKDK